MQNNQTDVNNDNEPVLTQYQATGEGITFEEFITRKFSAKTFNGSWWSNDELQWKDKVMTVFYLLMYFFISFQEGNLVTWNIHTNTTTILVSNNLLTSFSTGAEFKGFSPDNSLLLFAFDISYVWRHSYTARYVVFDSSANVSYNVVAKDGSESLQYCDWVTNEKDENILVYVSKNNIYWKANGEN